MGMFSKSSKKADTANPVATPPPKSSKKGKSGKDAKLFATPAGASDELKKFIDVFAPYAEKSDAGEKLRKIGFRMCDPNGNGLVSLAEAETFVMKALMAKYPKTKAGEPGRDAFDAFRPCYIRAFNDAKDFKADDGTTLAGTKSAKADDFVSKGEFRLLCAYFVIYAAMFDAFAKIDGGGSGRDANDDKRIEKSEWMAGYKGTTNHGFVGLAKVTNDKTAAIIFGKMDSDKAGMVLLDEWCTYLKNAEIAAGTDTGLLLAMDEEGGAVAGGGKGGSGSSPAKAPPKAKPNSFGLCVGTKAASKEYFDFASVFEPMCAENKTGEALRKEGFKAADPNGNGLCSLAELETFVLKSLMAKFPKTGKGKAMQEPGKDMFKAFRPCYIRAFTDAKDYEADHGVVLKGTKKATNDDFVSEKEFRLFCVYTIVYAAMFDAFAKVDGGGAGRDANDDKRVEEKEWMAGYKGVTGYGFEAFSGLGTKKEARAAFEKMDDNGGGIVLLDEWCEFIKAGEVKAGTPVGKLLAMDEAGGTGKNYALYGKAKVTSPKHGKPANFAKGTAASASRSQGSSPAKKKGEVIIEHNKWNEGKKPPQLKSKTPAAGKPAGRANPNFAKGTKF